MQVQPYLNFEGCCEEAINFYVGALGAEVGMLMRFSDNPDFQGMREEIAEACMIPPGSEDKVMHASFRIGDATIMASDGRCTGQPVFEGFSLSITVPNDAKADAVFATLSDGGEVQMPLQQTFFSSRFGMVADKYGVSWMIVVAA